jgi:phosphate starvation-inducible protein PhoH
LKNPYFLIFTKKMHYQHRHHSLLVNIIVDSKTHSQTNHPINGGIRMTKRHKRAQPQEHAAVLHIEKYRKERQRQVEILPKNMRQEDYLALLEDQKKHIVFAIGPAGTGKTLLACLLAVRELKAGRIDKVIITRPAVSVDEQHGFLPGTLIEKMQPWTRPIFDVFEQYWAPKYIENMIEENVIEVAPLAYMRGRTFENAIILADEMQNATPSQMKMLLTRIGNNSRIFVTGDLAQHDRGYEANGLKDFITKLQSTSSKMIGVVEFEQKDVERHPAVAEVLKIYGEN